VWLCGAALLLAVPVFGQLLSLGFAWWQATLCADFLRHNKGFSCIAERASKQ
jgi:hypothetical protein